MFKENRIDFEKLIAPHFKEMHDYIKKHKYTHYILEGGRGSTKSSFVAMEMVLLLMQNPCFNGVVFRKHAVDLRNSVYRQYLWAIEKLGVKQNFKCTVMPMEMVYLHTGQRIIFCGADNADNIKSLKAEFGYFALTHFEEKDQFESRKEIRKILQATMRGGELFWNFETNNPPAARKNWANIDSLEVRADRIVHKSDYINVPRHWLGEAFFTEADFLKKTNINAYRHEYLGEPVGHGREVFENLELRSISSEEINCFEYCYMGVDWGFYPDPFAWNKMYYDAARRTIYIYDEATLYKSGNRESANLLINEKGVCGSDLIIADSAENKSISDFNCYGLWCKGARKGRNSIDYSMKWLRSAAKIIIDPMRCPCTAKEFCEYEYEKLSGKYPDKNNHHIDAVRYGLQPLYMQKGV